MANPTAPQHSNNTSQIILQQNSTVTITVWKGTTGCGHGGIYLVDPDLVINTVSKRPESKILGWDLLFADYATGKQSLTIGPYSKGTALRFGVGVKTPKCSINFTQDSGNRGKITSYGNRWTIDWEDSPQYKDGKNWNDIHMEIIAHPTATSIETNVVAQQAFNSNPVYGKPWPANKNYPLTAGPNQGHHGNIYAFDYGMAQGTELDAVERGQVLWVEDSFGSGSCSLTNLNRVNVVVIQTEEGVNVNYLHIKKGSAAVKVGELVQKGQKIAEAGNSGMVCTKSGGDGSHLHIEWVHHCKDIDELKNLRKSIPVGKPTFAWSCPNFTADAGFNRG
ncbi:MAG TPA: M23 family metallopeptidase [Candidatus Saccharimonadales bacterium]|nr:M23 family metallopeptidase [Candidatus Saccharimonadales bacterium]